MTADRFLLSCCHDEKEKISTILYFQHLNSMDDACYYALTACDDC